MKLAFRVLALPPALGLFASFSLAAANTEAPSSPAIVAQAQAPGVAVKVAAIAAGRLVIVGTTSRPGVDVAISGTPLRAKSDAQGLFRFDVNYRTPNCHVTLATQTGTLAVLIGDCGPQGVVPRGAWVPTGQYASNDLVLDGGTTWRAVRSSKNRRPAVNSPDWQLFAARGAAGPRGLLAGLCTKRRTILIFPRLERNSRNQSKSISGRQAYRWPIGGDLGHIMLLSLWDCGWLGGNVGLN